VTLAEQLEEAEELARVVRVLEILGLRRAVGHSETFGLVAPLERIEIQHAATDHTTLTVHVNFYLLFAHCRPIVLLSHRDLQKHLSVHLKLIFVY